jgi:hypothetical protein
MEQENKTDGYPVPYLIYNFALIAMASYLVAVFDWSLWTYAGFAFFLASKSD